MIDGSPFVVTCWDSHGKHTAAESDDVPFLCTESNEKEERNLRPLARPQVVSCATFPVPNSSAVSLCRMSTSCVLIFQSLHLLTV